LGSELVLILDLKLGVVFTMLACILPMLADSLLFLVTLIHADFNVANLKRCASARVAVAHAALAARLWSVLTDLL